MNIFNTIYDLLFSNIALGGFMIIFVVFAVYLIILFNSLVSWRNRVKESWSDIEVQLKRRMELIPNLVEAVKGYMAHEKNVLEKLTEARSSMLNAQSAEEYASADNMLAGALKSLFAVAENYPDLKASENFLNLQNELSDTENKIQAARRFYNATVRDYNIRLESFPSNIVASLFSFKPAEFFELEEDEKEKAEKAPEINFN